MHTPTHMQRYIEQHIKKQMEKGNVTLETEQSAPDFGVWTFIFEKREIIATLYFRHYMNCFIVGTNRFYYNKNHWLKDLLNHLDYQIN